MSDRLFTLNLVMSTRLQSKGEKTTKSHTQAKRMQTYRRNKTQTKCKRNKTQKKYNRNKTQTKNNRNKTQTKYNRNKTHTKYRRNKTHKKHIMKTKRIQKLSRTLISTETKYTQHKLVKYTEKT